MPDVTTELEAAAFRRLLKHLQARTDVQNIDLMIKGGFCRNCLADWYRDAAVERGLSMDRDAARELIYGQPFTEWKTRYQGDATAAQLADLAEAQKKHPPQG
ncbi:DUF1244 domain-containing protein [Dokdonella sp.]|uniref:DUF1244 domain-containing protein n=1 Tax=Dokdonella sp. TaxID=2291710 RepID=UPI003C329D8A